VCTFLYLNLYSNSDLPHVEPTKYYVASNDCGVCEFFSNKMSVLEQKTTFHLEYGPNTKVSIAKNPTYFQLFERHLENGIFCSVAFKPFLVKKLLKKSRFLVFSSKKMNSEACKSMILKKSFRCNKLLSRERLKYSHALKIAMNLINLIDRN
jgi:hypothetical protein